jgi:hypothetical protein
VPIGKCLKAQVNRRSEEAAGSLTESVLPLPVAIKYRLTCDKKKEKNFALAAIAQCQTIDQAATLRGNSKQRTLGPLPRCFAGNER